MPKKDQIKAKKSSLAAELERLKDEEALTLVQKEAEIKESSEALKQQMLHKIRQKKAELFSLKKDNFGEEIEIVLQQNYHYTNQLDYQTKHFEYLIVQNEKLKIQLENIGSDYEVHRNIQGELAKRVFLSGQIIEELNRKNEELDKKRLELTEKLDRKDDKAKEALRGSLDEAVDGEWARKEEDMAKAKETRAKLVAENSAYRKRLNGFVNMVSLLTAAAARVREAQPRMGQTSSDLPKLPRSQPPLATIQTNM